MLVPALKYFADEITYVGAVPYTDDVIATDTAKVSAGIMVKVPA